MNLYAAAQPEAAEAHVPFENAKRAFYLDGAIETNGEEFHWIIYLKYMAPNGEKCANDVGIVSKLREKSIPISQSTFYRRLNAAIGTLSGVLWGFTARDTLQLTEIINKLMCWRHPQTFTSCGARNKSTSTAPTDPSAHWAAAPLHRAG